MSRSRSALTLIEILVVVILAVFVLGFAIQMWRQYSFEMARTATRQQMQQEARQIMQQLAGDVRSADASGITAVPASDPSQAGFSQLRLERVFFPTTANAEPVPGAEVARSIQYVLAPPLLQRTGPLNTYSQADGTRILSNRVADCQISLPDQVSPSATAPRPTDQSSSTASSSSGVEIVLSMSAQVPGSRFMVWHVERTSVFPRAATSQGQHPGSRSLADLTTLSSRNLEQAGDSEYMNSFQIGEQLTASGLTKLSDGDLNGLKDAQESNLKMLEKAVKNANQTLADIRPSNDWSWASWWGETNLEQARSLGASIINANTLGTLEERRKEFEQFFDRFSTQVMQQVFPPTGIASESESERSLKAEVLRMKTVDRLVLIERQSGTEQAGQAERKTQFEVMTEQFEATRDQQPGETAEAHQERRAREQRLLDLYQSCNIRTLIGGAKADGTDVAAGKESNEFQAFQYAQNCRDLVTSKLTALRSKELTEANIRLIQTEQQSRPSRN